MNVLNRLTPILLLPPLFGCSDSGSGPEDTTSGTYTLQTINGQSLPYVIAQTGTTYKLEFIAGAVTLNSNGTYVAQATSRETNGSTVTTETNSDNGTFTRTNATLSFRSNVDASTATGTISGNTLTVGNPTFTLVYRK